MCSSLRALRNLENSSICVPPYKSLSGRCVCSLVSRNNDCCCCEWGIRSEARLSKHGSCKFHEIDIRDIEKMGSTSNCRRGHLCSTRAYTLIVCIMRDPPLSYARSCSYLNEIDACFTQESRVRQKCVAVQPSGLRNIRLRGKIE